VKQVFEYVNSFVTIALVLAGIGGFAYNLFKDGGWLGLALGKFWDVNLRYPVIAIPVTIAVVIIGKLWYDHSRAKGHTSRLPDVLIYVIMAAGVYFIWDFVRGGF